MKMEISIDVQLCSSTKMEAIGCFVPELRCEKHHGRGMQLFVKTQCIYVGMVHFNVCVYCLCYVKLTCVLVKRQLESRQRQLKETAVMKAGTYIASIDRKTTVNRLEAGEIALFEKHVLSCP